MASTALATSPSGTNALACSRHAAAPVTSRRPMPSMAIRHGVGSRQWTNALAVTAKAHTGFGYGPRRLTEPPT
jgi:hypothetical protein